MFGLSSMWLGMCDTPNGTLVVIAEDRHKAEAALWREYPSHVYAGFCKQNGITSFETLKDWNGASVKEIPVNQKHAVIWERCQ